MEDLEYSPNDTRISLQAAISRKRHNGKLFHRQHVRGMRQGIERKRDLKRTLRDHRNGH